MKKIRLFCISLKTNTDKINSFFFNFHTPCWQQLPCQHDFFILSPRCETGVCRTGLSRPPDTLQYPFPLQHVPDATLVAVFLCKGIIIIRLSGCLPPTAYVWALLTLFLHLLRFLVWSASFLPYLLPLRTNVSSHSSWPCITQNRMCRNVLCPLRYFYILASEMTRLFQKNITIPIFSFQGSLRLKTSACQKTP